MRLDQTEPGEIASGDADYGGRVPIQVNDFADHQRIGAEVALPEAVSQDHRGIRAGSLSSAGSSSLPRIGARAQFAEIICGDKARDQLFLFPIDGHTGGIHGHTADRVLECSRKNAISG